MREFVDALCSDRCAGREAGTPGGLLARELVVEAFAEAGYDPELQLVPAVGARTCSHDWRGRATVG